MNLSAGGDSCLSVADGFLQIMVHGTVWPQPEATALPQYPFGIFLHEAARADVPGLEVLAVSPGQWFLIEYRFGKKNKAPSRERTETQFSPSCEWAGSPGAVAQAGHGGALKAAGCSGWARCMRRPDVCSVPISSLLAHLWVQLLLASARLCAAASRMVWGGLRGAFVEHCAHVCSTCLVKAPCFSSSEVSKSFKTITVFLLGYLFPPF